jgi:uncharacterized protein
MSDFRKMTVEALRKLAQKVVGAGHSRLRTKRALVETLEAAERRLLAAEKKVERAAGKAAVKVEKAKERAARAVGKVAGRALPGAAPAPKTRRRPAVSKAVPRAVGDTGGAVDPEGFFVARVRGEEAVRQAPHPMTEGAVEERRPAEPHLPSRERRSEAARDEEGLGDLPWSYEDDTFLALPRDPRTLFLYWDHARHTVAEAFAGLEGARAQLWLFERGPDGGYERLRAIDFALESRCYYVHDLEPGRTYRAEIHVAGGGKERMLARPSNEVQLPNLGPSPTIDDRFARIPWDLPLSRWLRDFRPGQPFSEEARLLLARLSDWSRFSGRAWGGSAGGMGGRPFSPAGAPSSPSPRDPRGGKAGA